MPRYDIILTCILLMTCFGSHLLMLQLACINSSMPVRCFITNVSGVLVLVLIKVHMLDLQCWVYTLLPLLIVQRYLVMWCCTPGWHQQHRAVPSMVEINTSMPESVMQCCPARAQHCARTFDACSQNTICRRCAAFSQTDVLHSCLLLCVKLVYSSKLDF